MIAFLFAYSTMISWSYYGEQCWAHLFGVRSILLYKLIFLVFTWLGAIFEATAVIDFGDMMILGMAFPNLIGVVLLSGVVRRELDATGRSCAPASSGGSGRRERRRGRRGGTDGRRRRPLRRDPAHCTLISAPA